MFGGFDAICKNKNVKQKKPDFNKAQKEMNAGLLLLAKSQFKVFFIPEIMKMGKHMEKMKPVHKELKKTVKKK